MITQFHSSAHGALILVPGLPKGFEGPFLAGSIQLHFTEEYGSIVVQEIENEQFRFQFLFFHFLQKVRITGRIVSGLQSIFMAKGEARQEISNKKKIIIKESQFLLLQTNESEWKIEIKSARPLHLLNTAFSKDLAEEISAAFPSAKDFLNGTEQGIKGPFAANGAIREAVHKILHADHEAEKLPFYFKNKIEDYLFQLLDKATRSETSKLVATMWEKQAVYKVRDMILANILEHHSIAFLAKKAKINPYRLKVFFKQEFEVGPYEFLLNARLDKAKELMEEGMPMKKAAPLAGYRTTSFITAFKRRFGYSPGAIQRKK